MKLIIAGGRDYKFTATDFEILDALASEYDVTEVVSGCARGADTEGELWAASSGIPVKEFPAQWDKFGKSAGYRRNAEMADYADAVVLFPGGKGTNHMYDIAKKKGLVVFDFRQSKA